MHLNPLRAGLRPRIAAICAGLLVAASATQAQERPAKRVANIVEVAVEEYGKGIDSTGRSISEEEYREAVGFLSDARDAAARISGERADSAQAGVDSLLQLMKQRVPPAQLVPVLKRIVEGLGAEAALDMPTQRIDLAAGKTLFEANCATCHGPLGNGDGPLAKAIHPPPPALGSEATMADRSPASMYRIVSVGMSGTQMAAWAASLTPTQRWNIIAYVNTLRAPASPAEGQGLYVQQCAACHGASGGSNGTETSGLSRLPAELSSFAWQAERSDSEIAQVIRNGIAGTAMPPSRSLTDAETAKIIGYIRTLAYTDVPTRVLAGGGSDATVVARRVLGQLDDALASSRAGRHDQAYEQAFDAYLTFEPLETPARARDPGLVSSLERHFADFKGSIKARDDRAAERSRNAIEAGMPGIIELTTQTVDRMEAFVQSLVIIVREGFEAMLVISVIVAILLKTGQRRRLRAIWLGVGSALGASLLTAVVLATVLSAIPASREIIEGVTMLVAVLVLFSVSYWLISKVEAAKWQQFIKEKVTAALDQGGGKALAVVAFLAVYREGAETVLFYQALFQEAHGAALAIGLGIAVGVAILVVLYVLLNRYGLRIPLRPFFAVTSALLYYLAFVFMGKGVRELQEGNVVSITVLPGWPHVEAMGIFPSVETLLAQLVLVALFVFAILKTIWPKRSVALPTIPPDAARPVDVRLSSTMERLERVERRLEEIATAGAPEATTAIAERLDRMERRLESIDGQGAAISDTTRAR